MPKTTKHFAAKFVSLQASIQENHYQMQIKRFTFNPFQVNTFVLFDQSGQCVLVDPACGSASEQQQLADFIIMHKLEPTAIWLTHAHIDHVLGVAWAVGEFGLEVSAHADSELYLRTASEQAQLFGLALSGTFNIDKQLNEGQEIGFGQTVLKVLHTPGHALGSVCFYHQPSRSLFAGDVLFHQSIGRTDLPGGDYDVLKNSIWLKLFTLPDATVVYPGHGPETTIGNEKVSNPFVAIGV